MNFVFVKLEINVRQLHEKNQLLAKHHQKVVNQNHRHQVRVLAVEVHQLHRAKERTIVVAGVD